MGIFGKSSQHTNIHDERPINEVSLEKGGIWPPTQTFDTVATAAGLVGLRGTKGADADIGRSSERNSDNFGSA